VAKDYVTNNDGLYDTSSIVTGRYQITFTKAGFNRLFRGPITIQLGFTGVNAQLKVGSTAQEVVVTSKRSLLESESGEQQPRWKRSPWRSCRTSEPSGRTSPSCFPAHPALHPARRLAALLPIQASL